MLKWQLGGCLTIYCIHRLAVPLFLSPKTNQALGSDYKTKVKIFLFLIIIHVYLFLFVHIVILSVVIAMKRFFASQISPNKPGLSVDLFLDVLQCIVTVFAYSGLRLIRWKPPTFGCPYIHMKNVHPSYHQWLHFKNVTRTEDALNLVKSRHNGNLTSQFGFFFHNRISVCSLFM